jgi:threonine/homoserine/homoserine lactone efflux protein
MSLEFIILYSTTVFIASITPGPSMILALNHGIKYGAKKTLVTALGNVTATVIQALLSIAGLGAILLSSESIFNTIKYFGAIYLVYIGVKMFFSSNLNLQLKLDEKKDDIKLRTLYFQAFFVTAGNPKAIIFFTALFPQFINTQNETAFQFFVILSILSFIAFICMMIYGIFGQQMISLFSKSRVKNLFNRLVGGTLVGMGIGLATGKVE